jgi:two-component system, OmpR family, sensor histidine kinase MprB
VTLRWKIALSLAAVGVVMTALVGVFTYRSASGRLIDEIDRSIDQAGQVLAVSNERLPQRREVFDVYSFRRVNLRGEVAMTTFDDGVPVDDAVIASVAGQFGLVSKDTVVADDGERYRLHTTGLSIGVIQVGRSLEEVDAVLADLRRRTLLLSAVAAAISALAGWLIASRMAAPLRRLASSADQVRTSGRLDVVLPEAEGSSNDEVGQLSRAFASMLGALASSKADQERLVQDAGHELRTPLTSLRTNLAVMRRHQQMPDEMRTEILDDLDGEVSELTDLVNELVTVASGDLVTQPAERLDLAALVSSVGERVGRRRQRQVVVTGASGSFVSIPRAGLDRAVSNLIENACKFDTSGGPIEVDVSVAGDTAAVRVSDRGPGVPSDEFDKIFDRFHRTDATRSMPGSGLGLSIVRDVVTAHGGSVAATNRPGGGAIIGFDLPLVD